MHAPDDSRSLYSDRAFWGLTNTQFLGAFNDNLFKQLLLLLFVAVPQANGGTRDQQGLAQLMFAVPWLLFSGVAGFLSERLSKRPVIVACKVAEVAIMGLGMGALYWFGLIGLQPAVLWSLAGVLFLMGTHSAFFGPSKYGILPELFRERDLPAANGIVMATTFLAIILGSGLAGVLVQEWRDRLWMAGGVCLGIAVFGVVTSLLVRPVSPALSDLQFEPEMLAIPHATRKLIGADRSLLKALIASTLFWLSAALVQPSLNALGKLQLGVNDKETSWLVTVVSAGIAIGSCIAGGLARGKKSRWVQRTGAWGLVLMLALMALRGGPQQHLLGYRGSLIALTTLGVFTGMFAVPLQVFLQSKPPPGQKGRMIATQNLLNWLGIIASAIIYLAGEALFHATGAPANGMFAITALFVLPVALFYRPELPAEASARTSPG